MLYRTSDEKGQLESAGLVIEGYLFPTMIECKKRSYIITTNLRPFVKTSEETSLNTGLFWADYDCRHPGDGHMGDHEIVHMLRLSTFVARSFIIRRHTMLIMP
jgi:hypothetical protein